MLARLNHTRLLRLAGLFTWAVVGVPLLYLRLLLPLLGGSDELALPPMAWQGWVAYTLFGLCYHLLARGLGARRRNPVDYLLLLLITAASIGLSYYTQSGLGCVLLMVMACLLPWLLPSWLGASWLILSQLLIVPVFMRLDFPLLQALLQAVMYAGFSGFVFVTSLVARQQAEARDEQRRLNAELRATRLLLAESARVNERTRIARELHDLLGHHLTALSLNLEVAGHLSEGRAKEHVQQGHTLAKLLLTDVREAVSTLRENGAIDLSAALRPLAENVPSLHIHMDLESPLTLDDAERAHVLLRCTQEIITNAVRHAGAGNLWIVARRQGGAIAISARDDGRGSDGFVAGNGLRGMRERLAQYGGTLSIDTRPDAGFHLQLSLPVSASAAPCEGVSA